MSIDLSKLWPAGEPFEAYLSRQNLKHSGLVESFKFVDLARNAFDVMMQRGWHAEGGGDEWAVIEPDVETPEGTVCSCLPIGGKYWPDQFTALVEADKWIAAKEKA